MSNSESTSNQHQSPGNQTIHGGFVAVPEFVKLQLVGKDCKAWLHNFCTADVKALQPGEGTEAFVLNVKGKTIAHVYVLVSEFDVTLVGLGQPGESLHEHFDRYIIREDVSVLDQTEDARIWLVIGPTADEMIAQVWPDGAEKPYVSHWLIRDNTIAVKTAIGSDHDWLVIGDKRQSAGIENWLETNEIEGMSVDTYQASRIRAGTPLNGREVNTDRLPQEFCRDERAISFKKGCYLGQETVARIDALGHVNYSLVRLHVDGPSAHEIPTTLELDGKAVGTVTSAAFGQGNDGIDALGFVRRVHAQSGKSFDSAFGKTVIV